MLITQGKKCKKFNTLICGAWHGKLLTNSRLIYISNWEQLHSTHVVPENLDLFGQNAQRVPICGHIMGYANPK